MRQQHVQHTAGRTGALGGCCHMGLAGHTRGAIQCALRWASGERRGGQAQGGPQPLSEGFLANFCAQRRGEMQVGEIRDTKPRLSGFSFFSNLKNLNRESLYPVSKKRRPIYVRCHTAATSSVISSKSEVYSLFFTTIIDSLYPLRIFEMQQQPNA